MKIVTLAIVVGLLTLTGLARPMAQAAQERKAIRLEARIYDAYAGEYELTPTFIITIRRTASGLSLQATDQPEFELFAESETGFFLTVVDAQITFVKNEKGEVTHLILHQNGASQKAVKRAAPDKQASAAASTTPRPAPVSLGLPVEMRIPIAPTPVRGEGKTHLAYELHLTNFSAREMSLIRLEVLDGSGKQLAQYEGQELDTRMVRPGLPPGRPDKLRLGGGLRAIIYLWLMFDSPSAVPAALRHRLLVRRSAAEGATPETEEQGESREIKIRREAALVLAPPLRGGEWVAANGPSNTSGHRRALLPVNSGVYIAQRFAIDWVQLHDSGQTFTGDRLKNESYRCYGAEALAVADAVVVAVKDGIPENIPGANSRAVPVTLETIGGNYVILDLGGEQYAFYAHLQPGSLRVRIGEKVRRGQVLGLVGNSGNSTEPHLHFHVSDASSPLGAEGLPYVFESFEVQGSGASRSTVEKREREIPMQNAIIRFPGGR